MAIHSVPNKPTSYDVGSLLDGIENRFKEGMVLISQLRMFTEEGDEEPVRIVTDLLALDPDIYIKSAKDQGIWASKVKEENNVNIQENQ